MKARIVLVALALGAPVRAGADAGAPHPAHLRALGPALGDQEGVVFADPPDSEATLRTRRGARGGIPLRDGQPLELIADDAAAGEGLGPVTAEIKAGGRRGFLANANVLTEDRLARSDDRAFAVFAPVTACGDACYYTIWALSKHGRKLIEKQAATMPVLLPGPRRNRYVIGSDVLYLVTAELEVTRDPRFHGPALAPDGTLFVRDVKRDAVFVFDAADKPRPFFDLKIPRDPNLEGDYESRAEPPVSFEQDGATVAVEFTRRNRRTIVRLDRRGKVLSKRTEP